MPGNKKGSEAARLAAIWDRLKSPFSGALGFVLSFGQLLASLLNFRLLRMLVDALLGFGFVDAALSVDAGRSLGMLDAG